MNKKEKEKKQYIAPTILLSAFIILTALFCIFTFKEDKLESINYTQKDNIKYSVCLKSNNYFKEQCLDNTKTYVADLIDYINVDFSYIMSLSSMVTQNYTYDITTQILATSKEDTSKVIYDKKETLVEKEQVKNQKGSSANIEERLKIDYMKYNNVITNFKKDYVLALDANLIITMDIKYQGTYNDEFEDIKNTKKLSVIIPLSEQTISIETDSNNNSVTKALYKNHDERVTLIILFILIGIDLIVAIIMVISIVKSLPYKKEYLKRLERILKEYDRAIVVTTKLPSFKNHNRVEVSSFEELLDARENLEKPILMLQSKKEDKATFCIITDNEVYIYILEVEFSEGKVNEKEKATK